MPDELSVYRSNKQITTSLRSTYIVKLCSRLITMDMQMFYLSENTSPTVSKHCRIQNHIRKRRELVLQPHPLRYMILVHFQKGSLRQRELSEARKSGPRPSLNFVDYADLILDAPHGVVENKLSSFSPRYRWEVPMEADP